MLSTLMQQIWIVKVSYLFSSTDFAFTSFSKLQILPKRLVEAIAQKLVHNILSIQNNPNINFRKQ